MSGATGHLQRTDIQVLRAIAVLSVVAFHLWPKSLPGGFAGVDVFFVISGFLITSLLAREIEQTGRINIVNFWIRRIRRIFPAAITVIIAVVVAVVLLGSPRQTVNLASHAIASTFSLENLLLWWESTDYDAQQNFASPLQHYWSLAVEEQFYLIWPLAMVGVVVIAARLRKTFMKAARVFILALGGVSFVYAIGVSQFEVGSYFDPFARAWELALGAAVALSPGIFRLVNEQTVMVLRTIGWVSLMGVFIPVGLEKHVPGLGVLPATLLAALLIALPDKRLKQSSTIARFTRDIMVWIGDRSFSIYLWHWPIILMAPFGLGRDLTLIEQIALLGVVLLLSDLTFRLVENPARQSHRKWLSRPKTVLPVALGICITLATIVVFVPTSGGLPAIPTIVQTLMLNEPRPISDNEAGDLAHAYPFVVPHCVGAAAAVFDCPVVTGVKYDPEPDDATKQEIQPRKSCDTEDQATSLPCLFGDTTSERKIALVGDSKAGTWRGAVHRLGLRAGVAVVMFIRRGCGYRENASPNCAKRNHKIREKIINGNFELVIVSQAARSEAKSRYVKPFKDLVDHDIPLVVIRDNTVLTQKTSHCISYTFPEVAQCTQPRSTSFRQDPTASVALDLGIPVIDFSDIYCTARTCAAALGGFQIHHDDDHMYRTFVLTLTPFLWSDLRQLGYFAD